MLSILKKICPPLLLSIFQEIRFNRGLIKKEYCVSTTPRLAFVVSLPEVWNSLQSVCDAAISHGFDVLILCVPRGMEKTETGSEYDFLKSKYQDICVYSHSKDGKWYDLKAWRPDYVFYCRPYNSEYPAVYKSFNVCVYSNVCYIPYGYIMSKAHIFESIFTWQFLLSTHYVFTQSDNQKKSCEDRFMWQARRGTIRFVNKGCPRFDLVTSKNDSEENRTVIAWFPRWEFVEREGQKTSHFLDYIKKWIVYAEKHKNILVVIRPHPLMFETMKKERILTETEIENLINEIESVSNVQFDNEKDYLPIITEADILVSDLTSLMIEYYMTGKPIVYCDTCDNFNEDAIAISESIYKVDGWDELETTVERLINSEDEMLCERKRVIKMLTPNNIGSIGKEIVEFIANNKN